MIKKFYYLNALTFIGLMNFVSAQQNKPIAVCGTDYAQKDLFEKNPEFKKIYDQKVAEFNLARKENRLQRIGQVTNQVIEVPIVVHILDDGTNKYVPTEAEINAWIARANAIFDGSAADIKGPSAGGTTLPVKLVLAKRTPNCTSTNGIVTHDLSTDQTYVDEGISSGKAGIDYSIINNTYNWDSSSYFNIYVTNKINGVNPSSPGVTSYTAGFATYPGQSVDLSVMLYHVVVDDEDTTFAHEMMHAFGVKHVFATDDSSKVDDGYGTTCGGINNDGIADTQQTRSGLFFGLSNNQYNQYKIYPDNNTINDCTNTLFDGVQHNMMNYGSKLDRFTPGQGQYATDVIYNMRPTFLQSKALIPIDSNETTQVPKTSCAPADLINKTEGTYSIGIKNFKIGSINVASGTPYGTTNPIFYSDNTTKGCTTDAFSTDLESGSTVNIELKGGGNVQETFQVYIDYNNDGTFTSDELVFNQTAVNNLASSTITIPTTAVKNTPLRMRVIGDAPTNYDTDFSPCGNRNYGEVEDYTVIINDPVEAPTIWDGSAWSTGLPTTTKEAIVRGDLSLTTSIIAKKLTVESGSVTVKSGSVLKVENEIINNLGADKFIVEDGASIIQTNAVANTGNVTVNKNSTPMVFNDATYWSSPVDGQNVRSFSPATLEKRFYIYNEGTNKFASLFVNDALYPNSNLQNPSTYTFVPGLGYHVRVSNTHTQTEPGAVYQGVFVGKLNNGNISQAVTKQNLGYNLLGNPYPSAIDANKLIQANSSIQALHFWTHEAPLTTAGYASNNYSSYNLTGGTQAAAGGLTPNNIISQGQGFIVESNANATITFDNTLRTDNLSGIFFKSTSEQSKRIWIDLYEATSPKNQILIGYVPNATNGFDNQMDATVNKLYEGSALYSLINDSSDKYVIQGRALPFANNDVVKLGVDAKSKGVYTIKLNRFENLDDSVQVFLYDKVDNQIIDLRKSDYKFDTEAGVINDRFEIKYINNATLGINDSKLNSDVNVYKQNDQVVVNAAKEIKQIEVYDVTGAKVLSKTVSGKNVILNTLRKANQFYVIKVTTIDNKVINTKILY